jgi:hypothetical protein
MICVTCGGEIRPGQQATPSLIQKDVVHHASLTDCVDYLRGKNNELRKALRGLQTYCQDVVPQIYAREMQPGAHLERLLKQAEEALRP